MLISNAGQETPERHTMASLLDMLSRRRFLVAAGIASTIVAGSRYRSSQASQATEHGDCALIPAMYWYREFQRANFIAMPYTELNEHLPQHGWTATSDPELGPFLVPPGWTTDNFFANRLDRAGSPIWGAEYLEHPRWTATMVTAPNQSAFYMIIHSIVDGVQVDSQGGARLVRELAIGPEVETEAFCLIEQLSIEGQLPMSVWVSGETFDDYLIMSNGHAIAADFLGMSAGPGSRVVGNVLVCPYDEADDYMREVFLRILWQFVPKAPGGAGEVTPTPSPTP